MKKVTIKNLNKQLTVTVLVLSSLMSSCTDDYEEINTNPNLPAKASTQAILGGVQYYTFAEPRFVTWRGNVLLSSQFAHQITTNTTGSWWAGGDAYSLNQGWTNNIFDQSYKKCGLNMRNLLLKYIDLNDKNGQAMAKITMSYFHQKMTDMFGNIPYSEVIVPKLEVDPPAYDSQKSIYKAIMEDLKVQMDNIGASNTTIDGANGDFVYNGDPQKWKAFANTLRLRLALRSRDAFNAEGENTYIDAIITDCLANPLIDASNEATLYRSRTSLVNANLDGGFEDVYWGFGTGENGTGPTGSKFVITERIISLMRDNNDPRLPEIATEAENGGYQGGFVNKREAPSWNNLSKPTEKIVGTAFDEIQNQRPVMLLTAAESYFLQAEAALLGYSGNAANSLYQQGILASINFWGANPGTFINNEPIATLSGSTSNQLNQVWNQRWLASITNGYESWSLVRRTNLIPQITDNVNFWTTLPNNGNVPKRLQYSTTEITSNAENVQAAINVQGEDIMSTPVWWDIN